MFENWKYWPIVRPIIALLSSRKFLVALVPFVAAWGLDLSPELITMIGGLAAVVIGGIAYEDGKEKGKI